MTARNCKKFHPQLITTSGTSGSQVRFYADKPSNILEFVFYWRFWGWADYKLGNRFAELSAEHFLPIEKYQSVFLHKENPKGAKVNRKETTEEQIVKKKAWFSASGTWQNMGNMLANSNGIIAAKRRQMSAEEEKQRLALQK